jgi:hypothetical protein
MIASLVAEGRDNSKSLQPVKLRGAIHSRRRGNEDNGTLISAVRTQIAISSSVLRTKVPTDNAGVTPANNGTNNRLPFRQGSRLEGLRIARSKRSPGGAVPVLPGLTALPGGCMLIASGGC